MGRIEGKSPWLLAWRRLRRNYVALGFLLLFVAIVVACALAPVYASHVAGTGPNESHLGETFTRDGEQVPVVSKGGFVNGQFVAGGIPVGPQLWHAGGKYVFGADNLGRDVAVRLLYGGHQLAQDRDRLGADLHVLRGRVRTARGLLRRLGRLDHLAFLRPDLGVPGRCCWRSRSERRSRSTASITSASTSRQAASGFRRSSSRIVLIPYVGRPLRGQILSLREKEFIEAATAQGASPFRVMFSELTAEHRLVRARLLHADHREQHPARRPASRSSAPACRRRTPSWGTLIADGQDRIVTAPWLAIVPGIAIVLTVLSLNVFGDGLRDALDPRAKVRIER